MNPVDKLRGHKFLPDDLSDVPRLYETDGLAFGRKVIHARFFTNVGSAEWLLAEFDGHDLAFGWVSLGLGPSCDEWGYFSLRKLGGCTW